ncbi:MAG: GH3 auxin-responsive promoter family protein, partial [Candidatus Sericytochromatia bacterium]|nr:GH3 auxin-responsive promoter family protein [Candidatus Tanganyikabacteria bacterium]
MILKLNLKLRERPHDNRFEDAAADPATAQREVLRDLIARNARTAFGREHGFASMRGPEDFRRMVPLRDYEAFRPYVRRIDAGETAVLTADPVNMLTTTSGTTGEPKLIPVTTPWREKMAGLMRLWYYRAMRQHPAMFDRKVLSIVSPAIEGHTPGGIPYGAMSGIVFKRTPWVVRNHYAVPYEVCLIQDYQARYFVTMRLALAQSVSCLGTPNPTSLLRLAETGEKEAEAIIRAIRDGTLGIPEPPMHASSGRLREQILGVIGKRLEADPGRARELERLVEHHGRLLPRDAWPELRLVACWLGGSAGIHAKRLAWFYGDAPLRDLGLIASEGRMTIPLADGTAAGALAIHANFYEF